MIVNIVKMNYHSRPEAILQQYSGNVAFFRAGRHIIALVGTTEVPFEVQIVEQTKVPLWKQSMEMQMGRRPRGYNQSTKYYRTQPITDIYAYTYDLYSFM